MHADTADGYYGVEKAVPEAVVVPTHVNGVWLVWNSFTKESLNAIFPQDQEIEALRKVNKDGYGYAEFTEWGEV